MKSISNQYKLLKEGKMTKYNFMRSVRTTFPQYITNVTSFDDAVRILRKKSLLSEILTEKNLDVDPKELKMGIKVEKEHTSDPVKAEEIALDHLKEDPKYYTKLSKAGLEENADPLSDELESQIEQGHSYAEAIEIVAAQHNISEDELAAKYPEETIGTEYIDNVDSVEYSNVEDEMPTDYGNTDDYNDGEFWEVKGGDEDAEAQAMIDKIEKEMAGEEAVKAQHDMPEGQLDESEYAYHKINGVCYKVDDEGNRTRVADHYCWYGESLAEAKSWTNASGKDMYAQFKEIDNLNGQEVLIGIDCEMEKNWDLSKNEAAKIVIKNLKKNPNYYTDYALAGKEMDSIPTIGKLIPGSDKMKPLKSEADLVDKDNGMKSVKGVEKVKASANKASKETNKPAGTISLMSLVAKTSKGVTKMVATGEKMKTIKEDYQSWLSQKKGEEAEAAKIKTATNADGVVFNIGDTATTPEGKEIKISGFTVDKDGKTKAIHMASTGMFADAIDVDGLTKKKEFRPGVNLGKYSLKDLTELVREVLAEMQSDDQVTANIALGMDETMDGRDNLTDVTGENK